MAAAKAVCKEAGIGKQGHAALDRTKIKANASKHNVMSYARRGKAEKQLEAVVNALLECAVRVDAQEDGKYGEGKTEHRVGSRGGAA